VRGLYDAAFETWRIAAMEFPVWSKAISAQGTVKARRVRQRAGGVRGRDVHPGDVIVADVDGYSGAAKAAAEVAKLTISDASKKRRTDG